MAEPQLVRYETHGEIGVITVDNPPVNALSPGVDEGILAGLAKANADATVQAVVLIGAGRSFIAGADIRQFGKRPARPPAHERAHVLIEQSKKPIVAAIHGFALGGGLERAMSCHYRIAVETAKVGLPEVLIGILPGSAGTQRLPRLAGPKRALEMIVSGRHVPAAEAKTYGILDDVLPAGENLLDAAIAYARKIAGKPFRRVSEYNDRLAESRDEPGMFDAMRKSIARRARNQKAPYNCILAVEAACNLPFMEGVAREHELFAELENATEAKALRYAFFAERECAKIPDLPAGVKAREINTAAVIGAGTMGGGITMSFADYGIPVKVLEVTQEALDRGMDRIKHNYSVSVQRGSLAQAEMDARLARITPVLNYEDIADADVAIEVVFEELPVKQPVFDKLGKIMKPGALLLSNTSAIDIDAIGEPANRPGDIAGAHFFSPANVMKLLEVVKGDNSTTSAETLVTTMALGRKIGKLSVVAGNTDGFVANRSRAPFNSEMVILLEDGCLPAQVDKVMIDFGYPMGPFAVGDLAGLDISAAGRRRRLAANPNYRTLPIADKLVEMGRYGQKTGAGWYRYEKGDRTPHVDPEVTTLIETMSTEMGKTRREFSDDDILRRLLFSSVNEACKILEEGKAYRASDIDVMWLHGFGFPRYRGGLMFWADGIGVRDVYNQIASWHQQYGERWAPSALLRELAESGTALRDALPKSYP